MKAFADLLDALLFTPSTLAKRSLIARYMLDRPDPERGLALAALTDGLNFAAAKPALIRELATERVDPVLFALSRDYVGDMAETVALLWPEPATGRNYQPTLEEIAETLATQTRAAIKQALAVWLDALDGNGRWALLKLITGHIRIGVSARLAKLSLADAFARDVNEIEEIWRGLMPPYTEMFAWLEGRGERPALRDQAFFMPMMLSHPIEPEEFAALDLDDYQIELKWDGIRVQVVRAGDGLSLFSRTGDDITKAFPDLATALLAVPEDAFVLDGELLATRDGEIAPFNALQQRLNRKKVTDKTIAEFPTRIRLYDMLVERGEDIRPLPLADRRARLENWVARNPSPALDLSEVIRAPRHDDLSALRERARIEATHGVEGLMIKKLASPYLSGRPRGHWFKWKRTTLTLDCVMMYAQRGSGKRSSFYSDYTFGVWQANSEGPPSLVPVGKAYSGFTDAELTKLDSWIRGHTVQRFGPVREVPPQLVLEIEFDSIHPSARHKSGLAMRFPRVHRIRWDKPADEADTIEAARRLVII